MKAMNFVKMSLLVSLVLCSNVALWAQRNSKLKQHDTVINSAVGSWALKSSDLKYYEPRELNLPVIGRGFADCVRPNDTISDGFYTRLPADMQNVREALWDLGQNSAGIAIRFRTNSRAIGAQWEPLNNFGMSHMTPTGVKGLDLYALIDGQWQFAGIAQPNGKKSRNMIVKKMDGAMREYLLYLPLYDGVKSLKIGIDSTAVIEMPQVNDLLPVNPATAAKEDLPIVFYGTSITQGGCATRPGMAFPAIIERKLHKETINLGFSGNGRMDKIMADKIAAIPASAYVIDCIENCTYQIVKDSTDYFIRTIAEANPDTPIYMVSAYYLPTMYLDTQWRADAIKENELWKSLCKKLRKEGYKNVKYIDVFTNGNMKKNPLGPDYEGCVDGIHFTDMGFARMAEFLLKYLK